jgi:hypothetical protein
MKFHAFLTSYQMDVFRSDRFVSGIHPAVYVAKYWWRPGPVRTWWRRRKVLLLSEFNPVVRAFE